MRRLLLVVAGAAFAVALIGRWSSWSGASGASGPSAQLDRMAVALLPAALLAAAGMAAALASWRAVLAGLGHPLPAGPAARIFFVGQLAKYVPGGVWPVVTQASLATGAGLPGTTVAAASVVTLAVSVVAGLAVGLLALPTLVGGGSAYALVLLALPAGLALLHPSVLQRAVALGLRLVRRPPLPRSLPGRAIAKAATLAVLAWLLLGLHVVVLAATLAPLAAGDATGIVGGFALAFVAGILVVVAPAGAGVREAVLTVCLRPVLDTPDALAVALTSRLVVTAVDGLLAAGASVVTRTRATAAP